MKEILIGIIAALFFAFTFILNHSMELEGGSWLMEFFTPLLLYVALSNHHCCIRGKDGFR